MKFFYLLVFSMLLFNLKANAQVPRDSIIGNWRLVALQGKQISENELLKKYSFLSSGEFTYFSSLKSIKGKYTLEPQTGKMSWVTESGETIWFELKLETDGNLIFKQTNHTGAPGILNRIN